MITATVANGVHRNDLYIEYFKHTPSDTLHVYNAPMIRMAYGEPVVSGSTHGIVFGADGDRVTFDFSGSDATCDAAFVDDFDLEILAVEYVYRPDTDELWTLDDPELPADYEADPATKYWSVEAHEESVRIKVAGVPAAHVWHPYYVALPYATTIDVGRDTYSAWGANASPSAFWSPHAYNGDFGPWAYAIGSEPEQPGLTVTSDPNLPNRRYYGGALYERGAYVLFESATSSTNGNPFTVWEAYTCPTAYVLRRPVESGQVGLFAAASFVAHEKYYFYRQMDYFLAVKHDREAHFTREVDEVTGVITYTFSGDAAIQPEGYHLQIVSDGTHWDVTWGGTHLGSNSDTLARAVLYDDVYSDLPDVDDVTAPNSVFSRDHGWLLFDKRVTILDKDVVVYRNAGYKVFVIKGLYFYDIADLSAYIESEFEDDTGSYSFSTIQPVSYVTYSPCGYPADAGMAGNAMNQIVPFQAQNETINSLPVDLLQHSHRWMLGPLHVEVMDSTTDSSGECYAAAYEQKTDEGKLSGSGTCSRTRSYGTSSEEWQPSGEMINVDSDHRFVVKRALNQATEEVNVKRDRYIYASVSSTELEGPPPFQVNTTREGEYYMGSCSRYSDFSMALFTAPVVAEEMGPSEICYSGVANVCYTGALSSFSGSVSREEVYAGGFPGAVPEPEITYTMTREIPAVATRFAGTLARDYERMGSSGSGQIHFIASYQAAATTGGGYFASTDRTCEYDLSACTVKDYFGVVTTYDDSAATLAAFWTIADAYTEPGGGSFIPDDLPAEPFDVHFSGIVALACKGLNLTSLQGVYDAAIALRGTGGKGGISSSLWELDVAYYNRGVEARFSFSGSRTHYRVEIEPVID